MKIRITDRNKEEMVWCRRLPSAGPSAHLARESYKSKKGVDLSCIVYPSISWTRGEQDFHGQLSMPALTMSRSNTIPVSKLSNCFNHGPNIAEIACKTPSWQRLNAKNARFCMQCLGLNGMWPPRSAQTTAANITAITMPPVMPIKSSASLASLRTVHIVGIRSLTASYERRSFEEIARP